MTCLTKDCPIISNFGLPGGKAIYCKKHSLENYVDVKNKTCLQCDKQPYFGLPGGKAIYCKAHAPENYVNVVSKKCLKCTTRANYGPLFQPKRHCAKHINDNEYKKNNPKCRNCKKKPIYTSAGKTYPYRCETHKFADDINIVEKKCDSCQLLWIIPDDQTKCDSCREYIKPSIRNRKENKIRDMLEANNFKYESHDKIVDIKCSRKRPDFVIDYNFYKVILEVDENQHHSYPCECEKVRMIQIQQDIGMNVLFIRFNPDNYYDNENNRIKSYIGREKKLLDLLNALKNTERRDHYLEVIYLYYDKFDGNISTDKLYY